MRDSMESIPNIFLKLAHNEMLLSYTTEELEPLVREAGSQSKKLLDDLWVEDGSLPLECNKDILNALTRWLFARGENPDVFADRIFAQYKNPYAVPKRVILRSYLPFISRFYAATDQRHLLLEALRERSLFHEEYQFFCKCEGEKDRCDYIVNFKDCEASCPMYARWIVKSLQNAPLYLDLPSFETATIRATFQSAELSLLERRRGVLDNDIFYVDGLAVGKKVPFGDCLRAYGINLQRPELENRSCIRIDQNVNDGLTGCPLLFKDCYYSAPVSITEFRYAGGMRCHDPFSKLMSALVKDEFVVWSPLQKAHDALMHRINNVAEVIYYEADDSISVNGKHLMRNVPARILRNILREYSKTGREEFENREFKRDPEICIDALNPNFESRLNRVVDHLQKVSDIMGLDRHRRGGFRFEPHCHIEFREEPTTRGKAKK